MTTPGGSADTSASAAFIPPPDDLKLISPFLQRAHETRKADPALSYWCNYHAAQLGIAKLSTLSSDGKSFLMQLMDTLEAQKKSLAGNEIVHGDDLVAKAYIENVALKVFVGADNEDRSGNASRATARRFLVAGNFIDVLKNFGPLEQEMEEKLKYAKWKAAEIGKALREGRKPTPGPPGEEAEEDADHQAVEALTGIQNASNRLSGVETNLPTTQDLDAEMAKLTAQSAPGEPVALSPDTELPPPSSNKSKSTPDGRRAASRLSYDGHGGSEGDHRSLAASPNFSMPLNHSAQPSRDSELGTIPPHNADTSSSQYFPQDSTPVTISAASSPHARPLPQPPTSNASRGGLPIPPDGRTSISPLVQPVPLPSSPFPGTLAPSESAFSHIPSKPASTNGPAQTHQATAPELPTTLASFPTTLDHNSTARVQKLAKWAISALDYEDVETARKQLREALEICEGRRAS